MPNLFHLIGFCFISDWLYVNDLFNAVFRIDKVVSLNPASEAHVFQHSLQIGKQQILIFYAAENG